MFRLNIGIIAVLCLVACWVGQLEAGTLRTRDAKMLEHRLSDARDLHTNILSKALAFHDSARESLAYGLVAQAQSQSAPVVTAQGAGHGGGSSGGHGGSSGGSGGSTGGSVSAGLYVQVTVHEGLECSAAVELEATFGINVCVQVEASNGCKSMMYTYNSLLLTEVLYSDSACKTAVSSHPIGVVAALVDACVAGVEVTVASSFVPPTGSGTLICEYATLSSCQANTPIQSLWVSASYSGSEVLGLNVDDSVKGLALFMGNAEVCVAANLDAQVVVGTLLSLTVDLSAAVYLSISATV